MAASMVGRVHTHLRNAVPLVWGSLRLAPTISFVVTATIMSLKPFNTVVGRQQPVQKWAQVEKPMKNHAVMLSAVFQQRC